MFEFELEGFNIPGFGHVFRTPKKPVERGNGIIPLYKSKVFREPFYMKQVHGGTVHLLNDSLKMPRPGAFGDGVITNIPQLPIMIFTADCIPLIIASRQPKFVGAIHASWRSISLGIIENALALISEELGANPSNIICCMGPGILGDDYEVGPEVACRFPNSTREKANDKFLLDLPHEILLRLNKFGVPEDSIAPPTLSTFREKWLPSYRRQGEAAGRIETIVWRE